MLPPEKTAIVVIISHRNPTFVALALMKACPASFWASMELEGLVQTFIAGDAAIHRAAFGGTSNGALIDHPLAIAQAKNSAHSTAYR